MWQLDVIIRYSESKDIQWIYLFLYFASLIESSMSNHSCALFQRKISFVTRIGVNMGRIDLQLQCRHIILESGQVEKAREAHAMDYTFAVSYL